MKFQTTILGCGSATPTLRHRPTAQLVEHDSKLLLFDCGEGTQLQLRRYGIKMQRINHIFITHLHGDHFLGLPGLISTMHLLGRTRPLHIYAAEPLKAAVEHQLRISHSRLRFALEWHFTAPSGLNLLLETKKLTVSSFPLDHRIACTGFLIAERPKERNIRPECIARYDIPVPRIRQIKAGADYTLPDGRLVPNAELTRDPDPPRSFAFCTDTAFARATVDYVRGVDLLYHESTFLEADAQRATETHHSTARQAGLIAAMADAGQLLLGHYSARYRRISPFLWEAKEVFDRVQLATEGIVVPVDSKD